MCRARVPRRLRAVRGCGSAAAASFSPSLPLSLPRSDSMDTRGAAKRAPPHTAERTAGCGHEAGKQRMGFSLLSAAGSLEGKPTRRSAIDSTLIRHKHKKPKRAKPPHRFDLLKARESRSLEECFIPKGSESPPISCPVGRPLRREENSPTGTSRAGRREADGAGAEAGAGARGACPAPVCQSFRSANTARAEGKGERLPSISHRAEERGLSARHRLAVCMCVRVCVYTDLSPGEGLISRLGAARGCSDEPSGDWPPARLALPL